MVQLICNLVVFQALWFLLVFFGDFFFIPALMWLVIHWFFFAAPAEKRQLPTLVALGLIMDSILLTADVLQFQQDFLPLWMIGLWCVFPTTLHQGLRWCWAGRSWILPLSSIGAALTYVGGSSIGNLSFGYETISSGLILACSWFIYFTIIRRLNGVTV